MIIRRISIFLSRQMEDFQVGDLVRRVGYRGVGIVENIDNGFAVVAWDKDWRDILPLVCLRRAQPCGHEYDRRGG